MQQQYYRLIIQLHLEHEYQNHLKQQFLKMWQHLNHYISDSIYFESFNGETCNGSIQGAGFLFEDDSCENNVDDDTCLCLHYQ